MTPVPVLDAVRPRPPLPFLPTAAAPGGLPELIGRADLAALPPADRGRYRRLWLGVYRRADVPEDLALRGRALARMFPAGVLCGRSAAALLGDDSAPADAPPEIWLPATRKAPPGRHYRYGALGESEVIMVAGVRATAPLRTCLDLVTHLGHDDAVVALDRLRARVPGLEEELAAFVDSPAGRGARRVAAVVRAGDPACADARVSRVRLELRAAGLLATAPGLRLRIAGSTVAPDLADPRAHVAVEFSGRRRLAERETLRRAGWTVLVVGGGAGREVDDLAPAEGPDAGGAGVDLGAPPVRTARRAVEALRLRGLDAVALGPLPDRRVVVDPTGLWG